MPVCKVLVQSIKRKANELFVSKYQVLIDLPAQKRLKSFCFIFTATGFSIIGFLR